MIIIRMAESYNAVTSCKCPFHTIARDASFQAVIPPSTVYTEPVVNELPELMRKTIVLASSSTVPSRLRGVWPRISSMSWSLVRPVLGPSIGVSIADGATQLTRMRWGAISLAAVRVRPMIF